MRGFTVSIIFKQEVSNGVRGKGSHEEDLSNIIT